MISPNLTVYMWTPRLLCLLVMPFLSPLSGCSPMSGGSAGQGAYTATLYLDGVKVADLAPALLPAVNFGYGSFGETTTSVAGQTITTYTVTLMRRVGNTYLASISITFMGNSVVPVAAGEVNGALALDYTAFSSVGTVENMVYETNASAKPTGTINLTRANGRLSGSFDFTVGRLRAVGQVDGPDTYASW